MKDQIREKFQIIRSQFNDLAVRKRLHSCCTIVEHILIYYMKFQSKHPSHHLKSIYETDFLGKQFLNVSKILNDLSSTAQISNRFQHIPEWKRKCILLETYLTEHWNALQRGNINLKNKRFTTTLIYLQQVLEKLEIPFELPFDETISGINNSLHNYKNKGSKKYMGAKAEFEFGSLGETFANIQTSKSPELSFRERLLSLSIGDKDLMHSRPISLSPIDSGHMINTQLSTPPQFNIQNVPSIYSIENIHNIQNIPQSMPQTAREMIRENSLETPNKLGASVSPEKIQDIKYREIQHTPPENTNNIENPQIKRRVLKGGRRFEATPPENNIYRQIYNEENAPLDSGNTMEYNKHTEISRDPKSIDIGINTDELLNSIISQEVEKRIYIYRTNDMQTITDNFQAQGQLVGDMNLELKQLKERIRGLEESNVRRHGVLLERDNIVTQRMREMEDRVEGNILEVKEICKGKVRSDWSVLKWECYSLLVFVILVILGLCLLYDFNYYPFNTMGK